MPKNLFNSIQLTKPKKNVFDLSHDVKMSMQMGYLVPSCVVECVPGDSFNISCDAIIRFAPLVAPVMHRIDTYMHYFFVPNRLLWPGWEKFITANNDGAPLPAFPTVDHNTTTESKLADYLGLPKPDAFSTTTHKVNALPFSAYQMIWNEYYRDQNLQDPIPFELVNGDNTANSDLYLIQRRAWEHDYFTSALPTAQLGTNVDIPLGDVTLKDDWTVTGGIPVFADSLNAPVGAGAVSTTAIPNIQAGGVTAAYDPNGTLEVSPTTINDLRRAFRLQEWLEKAMRGGSRYVESILNHFGVRSSDKRLQRPEYITGSKTPVVISEVLNTSDTVDAPQGNMAGHGVSVASGSYGGYYCEEHGYIIGIMSVMPRTAYQQGIPKHFMKTVDPFEYFFPSFANIGEQPVLKKEILAFPDVAGPYINETWGYVPRYAEYKFVNNRVAGQFRNSLDFWHLGRIFDTAAPPQLNEDFIECEPDQRIFAVTDPGIDYLYCHVLHKIRAVRCMPKFGSPSF